jgi:NADH-quinone oxidoreductase subunit N
LSLELQSLPGYILTAIKRDSSYSLEAGVKYFVLGVLSSAVFLYGISLIYMVFGSVNYEVIADILMNRGNELSMTALVGIIFIMFGLIFKLASAPLHSWIADVYQAVHSTVLTFFSIVPKLGVTYVIYVLYHFVFVGKYFSYITTLIGFFAFCSFFVGAIGAIRQTNFKRLLAYSAIANSGFLLLNILGDLSYSFIGLVVYSFSYMIASYGLISFVMYYWNETNDENNYLISDLSGLAKTRPFLSISVAGLLFSIAGIPPFIGFFGKLYILLSSISALHLTLAFCALMTSVISLVYYLGIIKVMYFTERNQSQLQEINLCRYSNLTVVYAILSILTIFFVNYFVNFMI